MSDSNDLAIFACFHHRQDPPGTLKKILFETIDRLPDVGTIPHMLIQSGIITAASGSIGGVTASHNRGGMYLRAKTIPTDPNSTFQAVVRSAMTTLANRWATVLTEAQRAAWETYANQVPIVNALGATQFVTGLNMYVRDNVSRIVNAIAIVDNGPTIYTQTDIGDPAPVVTVTPPTTLSIAFDNTAEWAVATGGFLEILCSRQQNLSIQFFKGPYRSAGVILGAATPPTSPAADTSPFALAATGKQFYAFRAHTADGRVSPLYRTQDSF